MMVDRINTRTHICYGIDLSNKHLIIVRLTKRKKITHEIVYAGETVCSDPSEAQPFHVNVEKDSNSILAGCIRVHNSSMHWITTPYASLKKARSVIPSLLDIQLPFPLEDCVYQTPYMHLAKHDVRSLAVATRQDAIKTRCSQYQNVGLNPHVLDHEGLALWDQSLEEIPIHGDTLRIIAYIGYDHSVLVFGKTFFQAAHSSQFGLTVYISSQKDTEPESVSIQDFTARIERLLQSHMTQETPCPVMWIWTGPGACEKELCSTIEKQIAPSTLTEMKFVEKPESFLARGLATRVFKKDLAPCNFRSGPLSHPQTLQWVMTRKMKRTMTSALCGLMLIALNMGWHFLIKQKNGQFQTVLTERASRLTGLSRIYKGQETYIVEQVFKEQVEMKTPFIKGVSFSLRPLFHKIGKIAYTDHIFIEDLFLGSERISLIGTVRQGHQTEKLAQYIREQGYTVTEEQQDSEPEKWVRFSIKGTQQNES